MKYTLLELVQRILGSMGSDEVNNISDTTESMDVANVIKECYFDIVSEIGFKEHYGLYHLDSSGDNTKPTQMTLPANALSLDKLKYNVGETVQDTEFRDLCFMELEEFMRVMDGYNLDETGVATQIVSTSTGDYNFKYRTDEFPRYYCTLNDNLILFDAVKLSVESTLTSSRTYCVGSLAPTFVMSNTYVPDLDARHFQLLLNAAKAQAFVEIKQTANDKAERKERRHRILAYKTKDSVNNRSAIKNYKGYGR